jgi:tetratricopeptide (TPR) repeat protein
MLKVKHSQGPVASNRKARRAAGRKARSARARHPKAASAPAPASESGLNRHEAALNGAAQLVLDDKLDAAIAAYMAILEADFSCSPALVGLGMAYRLKEEPSRAYHCLKMAVEREPENPYFWKEFGYCLRDLSQYQAAVIAFTNAAVRSPDDIALHIELGHAAYFADQSTAAMAAFDHVLQIDPDNVEALYGKGFQSHADGQLAQARAAYERVMELDRDHATACQRLMDLLEDPAEVDALIERAEQAIARGGQDVRGQASLHFAIARGHRRLKRYDAAFAEFEEANRILWQSGSFDREREHGELEEMIEAFRPELFERLKEAGSDTRLPVFIVGMPRSGSTLVEQIIASHRDVADAGEFTGLTNITRLLSEDQGGELRYPRDIGKFALENLARLGQGYLDALRFGRPGDALRITDKQLANFRHLGLIAVLFPNAAIIHCRRDPVDTCLSCYFQNFKDTEGHLGYSNDLEELGLYYRQYERLMAHWSEVLPVRLFEVDYEDMVSSQEEMSRRLIDYIGLPWDDACLDFHKAKRSVRTASDAQVRKPIYGSSVAVWRNYEKHLAPLKRALGIDE